MASHGKPWKRLGDGSLLTEDAAEGLGHTIDLAVLRNILFILLFLTVITVWVSRFDFGSLNVAIALLIASVKAYIVASYFMHLKFERKLILMYAIYPLVILFLLIGGTLGDVVDRKSEKPLPAGVFEAPGGAKLNLPESVAH